MKLPADPNDAAEWLRRHRKEAADRYGAGDLDEVIAAVARHPENFHDLKRELFSVRRKWWVDQIYDRKRAVPNPECPPPADDDLLISNAGQSDDAAASG